MVKNQPFLQQVNIPHIVLLKVSRNYICPLYGEYLQISPPPPLTWQNVKIYKFKPHPVILFILHNTDPVFFLLLVMDFKTMVHGRENIKYEKAIQQFGHNNPPTPPNPLSPLGITLQIYFFMRKGEICWKSKILLPSVLQLVFIFPYTMEILFSRFDHFNLCS